MGKKNNPPVRYENGKWITTDGLAFNTQSKAEAHANVLSNQGDTKKHEVTNDQKTMEVKPEEKAEKTTNNGKIK